MSDVQKLKDYLDEQPFYEVMQSYRNCDALYQGEVVAAFENVKDFIRKFSVEKSAYDELQKELAYFKNGTRFSEPIFDECYQIENQKLRAERDGARFAIEDRDKLHYEHIQKYEAERLRLQADLDLAIEAVTKLGNSDLTVGEAMQISEETLAKLGEKK